MLEIICGLRTHGYGTRTKEWLAGMEDEENCMQGKQKLEAR